MFVEFPGFHGICGNTTSLQSKEVVVITQEFIATDQTLTQIIDLIQNVGFYITHLLVFIVSIYIHY